MWKENIPNNYCLLTKIWCDVIEIVAKFENGKNCRHFLVLSRIQIGILMILEDFAVNSILVRCTFLRILEQEWNVVKYNKGWNRKVGNTAKIMDSHLHAKTH